MKKKDIALICLKKKNFFFNKLSMFLDSNLYTSKSYS